MNKYDNWLNYLGSLNVEQLKVMAYDSLRFIESYQAQLRAINEQIMKKENEQAIMPKAEEKPGLECQPKKADFKKTDK